MVSLNIKLDQVLFRANYLSDMKIINKKFLITCQNDKCFSLVPFKDKEFKNFKYEKPSQFFNHFWNKYEKFKNKFKNNNNQKAINNRYNGSALEIILAYLFTRENIKITNMDENIDVMFVKPDFLLIGNNNKKIFVSAKVSIRERWKQADWESIKYKEKYPNAVCILIMNDKSEYPGIKRKIQHLHLDKVYLASSNDIDDMINLIKE
jgi:hypothetical protein